MNKYQTEELDAFLVEAQLISQKVKDLAENRAQPEEIDEIVRKKAEDKRRREQAQLRREEQAHRKKIKGRQGKGIAKDFSHFCRHCHIEFELATPTCWKCNRPTMTLAQRQEQLKLMVEDYKSNKSHREQKRHKWEMFQKTQAAMWKKSSINFNQKWDYFVEDSDQEPEKEPILPKNDPNFMAMEADMEERKKRRKKDNQNAKRIKEKGNKAMKEGDYQQAIDFYTLALEHVKDLKSIYTNRALAYIKKKKYNKAIKDCTNVIEYMQVFQKVGENKDLMFKALSRRALSKKQTKSYKQALEDINRALELFPNDNPALLLKKQIQSFVQHSQTVDKLIQQNREKQLKEEQAKQQKEEQAKQQKESESDADQQQKSKQIQKDIVKELAQNQIAEQNVKKEEERKLKKQRQVKEPPKEQNPIKQIPKRLEDLSQQNVEYLIQLLLRKKQLKSIFVASKGIQKVLTHLAGTQSSRNEVLLVYMCLEGNGVGEKRVWDWGVHKIYDLILAKFQDQSKLNSSVYGYVDNLLQILVPMSLSDVYRPQLSSDKKSYEFIETLYPKLITKYKKQTMLLDNFVTYFSNICSGDSLLKNSFLTKTKVKVIIDSFYHYVLNHVSKNRQFLNLKQSIYSFIANIITNPEHRQLYVDMLGKDNKMDEIKQELQLYPRTAHNFEEYIENILSVTANAFLDSKVEAPALADCIFQRFIKNYENFNQTIVYRALLTVGRIKYTDNKLLPQWMKTFDKMSIKINPLTNTQDKIIPQVIKILNVKFLLTAPETIQQIPTNLFKLLTRLILNNNVNEQLFCNTCNLFGIWLDQKSQMSQKALVELRKMIGKLVEIAKEKIGHWRKSAAILLGKSSMDPLCKEELNKHHGMDVLKSIASQVLDKK